MIPSLIRYILLFFALFPSLEMLSQNYLGNDPQIKKWAKESDAIQDSSVSAAMKIWDKVEKRATAIGDELGLMQCYFERSLFYNREGKYVLANNSLLKSIKIAEKRGLKYEAFYYKLFQFDFFFGIENYDLVRLKLKELEPEYRSHPSRLQLRYLQARAELAIQEKKYAEAESIYRKTLKIALDSNDIDQEGRITFYLGYTLFLMKRCDEALPFAQRAAELDSLDKYYSGMLSDYSLIAQIFIECLHQPKKGLEYLEKSNKLLAVTDFDFPMDQHYNLAYLAYKEMGDLKMALRFHEKLDVEEDSMYSVAQQTLLADMENHYQVEKNQQQIRNLKERERDQQKIIETERDTRRLAYIGFGLMFLLFVAAAYSYFNSKRYNALLSMRERHKEVLLREVHHRINNSLQLISSLIGIQARITSNPEVKNILQQTEMRVHSMATLHDLLNEGSSPININVKQYLDLVMDFHSQVIGEKAHIDIVTDIPNVEFPSNKALPLALIVNELITNSIKYAFPNEAKGEIRVTLVEEADNQWLFSVSDNGVGLPKDYSLLIAQNNGLGCQIVNIMSEQIDAQLKVDSSNGAKFEIRFKVEASVPEPEHAEG